MAGKIKGITIEIAGETTKLQKALKDVEDRSRDTTKSLSAIEKSLKFNPGNTELVAQQQRNLKNAISETSEKLSILKEADAQAKVQLANGELGQDEYEELQREIIKTSNQLDNYKGRLADSESEQQKLQSATQGMEAIFQKSGKTIDDVASIVGGDVVEAFKKGGGTSEQMGEALRKLGDEFLDTGGDSEKLREELKKIDSEGNFDAAIDGTDALSKKLDSTKEKGKDTGATLNNLAVDASQFTGFNAAIELMKKLSDVAKETFKAISDSWKEVDDSLDAIVTSTGATGKALDDANEQYKNLYRTMPIESQVAADAIGEVNTQFGVQGKALEDTGRYMIQYANITGSDVVPATQAAKKAMDQYGRSTEDLPGMLDVVAKASQDTGVSTDKLFDSVTKGAPVLQDLGLSFEESVILMSRFEQSGVDGSKALGYLTKAQATAAKEGKNITDALDDFTKSAGDSKDDIDAINAAAKLFGAKGGTMMLKATQDGKLSFDDLAKSADGAAGTVVDTYNRTLDPADNFIVAQNNFKTVLADIGSQLQETFAPVIETITEIIIKLSEGFEKLPGPVKTAIPIILGVVTAIVGIGTAIGVAHSFLPLLGAITGGIGTAFSAVGKFFGLIVTNPVILVVAAIVAALIILIKHWDDVKEAATKLHDKVTGVFAAIRDFTTGAISDMRDKISNIFGHIRDITFGIWDAIHGKITGLVSGIRDHVTGVFSRMRDRVSGIWQGVKNAIVNPISTARDKVRGVIDAIRGFFDFSFHWPHIPLPHFGIRPSGWKIGDLLKGSIPHLGISWYKEGGIFEKPALIGVGEAGSEAVVPTHKLDKFFSDALDRIGATSQEPSIVINIDNLSVRSDDDIKRIAKAVSEEIASSQRRRQIMQGV